MPTDKRPSLAKKHTRQTTMNMDTLLNMGAQLFIDGEEYKVTMGDLSALDARELRRQVGMNFTQVLDAVMNGADGADIDHVAAVIWLARRVNGGEADLTFEEVAAETGYDVLEKIRKGAAAERARLLAEVKSEKKKSAKKIAAVPDDAATA